MNEENTQKLFKEFPEFFKHSENIQESLMAFGFEYSDGWFDLTYKLCKDIRDWFIKHRGKIPEEFYLTQCKEKFGGLRFYISCAPKEIHDMIHKAEEESYTICEICGKPGKLRDDLGWWLTLCNKHYEEKRKNK